MKKGFTLVELLAVIVILAIILAIAIPGISGIINSTTKGAFESDAKMLLKAINYKMLTDDAFDPMTLNETNVTTLLGLDSSNYQTIKVTTLRGKPYVIVTGKSKWVNLVASGSLQGMSVVDSGSYTTVVNQLGYDSVKGSNEPKLVTGMTPIKWNGTAWVDTTASDTDWYNYNTTDKKWANARTADGSMWVWIPRYIYRISTGWHTVNAGTIDVQFSKGIDDNWNSSSIGNIDTGATSNASNNKWTNHPAFTFGSTQLTGIWIAKFEASGALNAIDIKPNATSFHVSTISSIFDASRNMETNSRYGWGTSGTGIDTHMMKNTEWGVTAYLSKATFGKNTKIYINNSNTYVTGCSGGSTSAAEYAGCQYTYETVNGQGASTTGNIYGIYDMSGGAWEYVAAYINNTDGSLAQGSSVTSAAAQYKDVYTPGATDDQPTNHELAINFKGDAVYETSNDNTNGAYSWFGNDSYMPGNICPWFVRGGHYGKAASAGAFALGGTWVNDGSSFGFRPVLLINVGL